MRPDHSDPTRRDAWDDGYAEGFAAGAKAQLEADAKRSAMGHKIGAFMGQDQHLNIIGPLVTPSEEPK